MQLFKNKKVVIACVAIVVLVVVLIVVGILVFKKPKQYVKGEMTLVDTVGKGNGHALDIFINKDQNIVLEVEDSLYANFYVKEWASPIVNVIVEKKLDISKDSYTVAIETKPDGDETSEVTYPYDGEIILTSENVGIEYKINYSVDKEITYKGASVTTNEVDISTIPGYSEYTEKYGELYLPKNANLLGISEKSEDYSTDEKEAQIEVSIVKYVMDGDIREIIATSTDNKDVIDAYYAIVDFKSLDVNGVEARVYSERGIFTAIYTIENYIYINQGFCIDEGNVKDKQIIDALKPFISK